MPKFLWMFHYPRFLSWTGASVRFSGLLARRDDDADSILLGGATTPGGRQNVQSRLVRGNPKGESIKFGNINGFMSLPKPISGQLRNLGLCV